tara:strand:- start:96 stop:746 length:651 start_codon:yes stop_codon:yes gene_type:complete
MDVQDQIIRAGTLRVLLSVVRNAGLPFEKRAVAFNVLEAVAMQRREGMEKELNEKDVLENVLFNFLQSENDGGIQIYGLCGLARVAFSSNRNALGLVEMGVVSRAFECIEHGMEMLQRTSEGRSILEVRATRKLAQMLVAKSLHLLMNVTVVKDAQLLVAKLGLRTIFNVCSVGDGSSGSSSGGGLSSIQHVDSVGRKDEKLLMTEIKMYAEVSLS